MNLFDLSLRLNGFPIKEASTAFKAIKRLNSTEYEAYFYKQREAIVNYHLKNNSFYKQLAANANAKDWNSIPVITKLDLQQPLENRLSKGFSVKDCYVNKTSGSSGTPFIFAKDKYSHAITWSGFIDRYGWYHLDFNT